MNNNSIFSLTKRLLTLFVLVIFLFFVVICRLFYIQFIKGKWLQIRAVDQWTRELPLNALRGNICDCNGVTLATNYSTYDIYVRASMVDDAKVVTGVLCKYLGLDYDNVYKKVTDRLLSECLIKLQVPKDIVNSIKNENVKGILFSENNSRHYLYKNSLTQVLGFTTIDNVGQAGLEAYYNKYLTGINGYVVEETDVKGVKVDGTLVKYIPSIPGMDLTLTIDINIQKSVEKALKLLMEEQTPKSASGIVMNPKNGEILAMATFPNFDLNNVPRDNIEYLMNTVKNINIVDVYEPGSTFKCVTMAEALDEGVATLDDVFFDPGYRMVDGEKIKCWKLTGHGMQTLTEGLCNSCNSVFVDLALRLGQSKMYEMFDKFGFGKLTNVDFLGESAGIIMDYNSAKVVDVARMGFGQAVAVTPLQLINAICSIVNGGKLYQPYFVKEIIDSNGEIVASQKPIVLNETISEETSELMKDMMLDVIKQYSGYNAFIPGFDMGGKTGTSQKYADGKLSGEYIASFVGTFPADDPEYVVLIVVDEPGGSSYYGSIAATPYAKLIVEDIIEYKNYKPNDSLEEDTDKLNKKVEMPSVVGLSVYSGVQVLNDLGLQVEIEGDGDTIMYQYPAPKEKISLNSVVMVGS